MKKFMIKSLVIIMMCAIVFSYAAVTASAANVLTYSGTCGNLFSCNLKGDIEGTTGYYRAMAKTTRKTDAYEFIGARALIEYSNGEYEAEGNTAAALNSVTVLIEDPVGGFVAIGVSSYHMMYNGNGNAANIEYLAGEKWLGYRA